VCIYVQVYVTFTDEYPHFVQMLQKSQEVVIAQMDIRIKNSKENALQKSFPLNLFKKCWINQPLVAIWIAEAWDW
jgi:hypothetical protein